MTSSQLPVNATRGGTVLITPVVSGSRATGAATPGYRFSQVAPLPVVTADSLRQAWNTQKTTQAPLPWTYEAAEVFAGMQYPAVPKKPGEEGKGWKVSGMTEA